MFRPQSRNVKARVRRDYFILKVRKRIIPEFTAIGAPYDVPENSEIKIDTRGIGLRRAVQDIYLYLIREGYISNDR